ncbi:MAG: hypothetical protein J5680_05035 [Neisseriaceae bacterium]|nr:hypothetical protein [Neisseriaceae bacterium]
MTKSAKFINAIRCCTIRKIFGNLNGFLQCPYNACGVDKKSYDFLLDCHDFFLRKNLAMTLGLFFRLPEKRRRIML